MTDTNNTPWESQIANELANAKKALSEKNDGRARACARRAVGVIVKEYWAQKKTTGSAPAQSAVDRLNDVSRNEQFPEDIRKAAQRLTTNVKYRLSSDFTLHPVHDAELIITYFKNLL
ncbi:hypothetical protein F9K33_15445 [bacterium]|nr:MAG: hypothetical protein F9K33_15445 [bacterium]